MGTVRLSVPLGERASMIVPRPAMTSEMKNIDCDSTRFQNNVKNDIAAKDDKIPTMKNPTDPSILLTDPNTLYL